MKRSRSCSFFFLSLGLILLVGVVFRSFLLDNLVQPVAFLAWLVVRLFLSIDQKVYWWALIFVAGVVVIRHFNLGQEQAEPGGPSELNVTLAGVKYWQASIASTQSESASQSLVKQRLIELLVSAYSLQGVEAPPFEISRALASGEIPLPEPIFTFLFAEPALPANLLQRWLVQAGRGLRRWVRRWTGQEAAAYTRAIGAVLAFIENALEMPNESNHRNH